MPDLTARMAESDKLKMLSQTGLFSSKKSKDDDCTQNMVLERTVKSTFINQTQNIRQVIDIFKIISHKR